MNILTSIPINVGADPAARVVVPAFERPKSEVVRREGRSWLDHIESLI